MLVQMFAQKCIDVKDMSIGTIANIDESACIKCNMCKKYAKHIMMLNINKLSTHMKVG